VTSCVCPAAMTAVVASPYLLRGYAAGITQACCGRNCPLHERFASGKKLLKVSVSALRADMTGRLTGMRRMPQGRPILWMPIRGDFNASTMEDGMWQTVLTSNMAGAMFACSPSCATNAVLHPGRSVGGVGVCVRSQVRGRRGC
jgi:hypothetical protein